MAQNVWRKCVEKMCWDSNSEKWAETANSYTTYDHITPALVQLQWLPVWYLIAFKHLFVYKSLTGLCSPYLRDLLEHRRSTRSVRSNFQEMLRQSICKAKTHGDRAFSVGAPKIWNTVPYENPVQFYHLRKSSRPSFLLNLLRVSLFYFSFIFIIVTFYHIF